MSNAGVTFAWVADDQHKHGMWENNVIVCHGAQLALWVVDAGAHALFTVNNVAGIMG